jgi:hypothetical protein
MELTNKGTRASRTPDGQTDKRGGVPLVVGRKRLAWLRIDVLCRLDATREFLAVDKSKIWVVADADSTPTAFASRRRAVSTESRRCRPVPHHRLPV